MTLVVIGLGPMGGAIGHHLNDLGRDVIGLDLDPVRAAEWGAEGPRSYTAVADVPWEDVDTAIIAVRLVEHLRASVQALIPAVGTRALRVIVVTTLAIADARDYLATLPPHWRVFEFPVSGGPEGARTGALSAMLAGPQRDADERDLLSAIARQIFVTRRYGDPAALKLINNTLGAYIATATARMAEVAQSIGIPAATFIDVARASSGQSWMADHFDVFHYPLLIKDVRLLAGDLGALPVIDLNDPDRLEELVLRVRRQLRSEVDR